MKSASISVAKNQLSALVKEVQGGQSVMITDRGVPVAQLVPVRAGRGIPARVIGLAQQGLARLPEQPPSAKWLDLPWPKLGRGPSAVDGLLAERAEGR
jgi:prevent-host-death family protein